METLRGTAVALVVLVATAWWSPGNSGAAPAPGPLDGVIATVDATSLTITLASSERVRVAATADTRILLRTSVQLKDIKPNDFVGVTARREPDGSLTAVSINIFPPEFKGQARQAQFVMQTGNIMTNAIVFQNVRRVDGRTLYLKLPDGATVINVPANTDIFRLTVAKLTDLKPGMRVVVRGTSNPDGSMLAASITADAPR